MNVTDRERIIADIADKHFDRLSDADIDVIYDDSELRSLYEAMCSLRRAADSYHLQKSKKFVLFTGRRRVAAAAFICVAVISATAVLFSIRRFNTINSPVNDEAPLSGVVIEDNSPVGDDIIKVAVAPDEDIVFENLTLDDIAARLKDVYGCDTSFGPDADHKLRLYMTIPAGTELTGVVAILNSFDAINASLTDNTIHID